MADSSKPIDPSDQKRLQTRGKGIGKDYQPFIFIQELSSSGESVRVLGSVTGRTHHLLSGIELAAFTIFDWHRATLDIREQFPLPIEDTLNICNQLGIKHPQIRGNLRVVTTDFLIDLSNRKPLALAVKSVSSLSDVRTIEKLQIEKTYWENQGIEWRLFTDHEVSKQLKENLLWLRPMLNEDNNEVLVDADEVYAFLARIEGFKGLAATKACARLDDLYGVEPGSHLHVLRYGVARHLISAPIQRVYHNWKCFELASGDRSAVRGMQHAN